MGQGEEHVWSSEIDAQAKAFGACGVTMKQAAFCVGISFDLYNRHYGDTHRSSKVFASRNVAGSLYRNATERNNVIAQIFWLKTQGGWRENESAELEENNSETILIEDDGSILRLDNVETDPKLKNVSANGSGE